MLTTLLWIGVAVVAVVALIVMVRTVLFERARGALAPAARLPRDEAAVAGRLAEAVLCRTVPLDDTGTPEVAASEQINKCWSGATAGSSRAATRGRERLQPALDLGGITRRSRTGDAHGPSGCGLCGPG